MTATLAGIRWKLEPCPDCGGSGTRRREVSLDQHSTRTIAFTCRGACQGRGTIRTLESPARGEAK